MIIASAVLTCNKLSTRLDRHWHNTNDGQPDLQRDKLEKCLQWEARENQVLVRLYFSSCADPKTRQLGSNKNKNTSLGLNMLTYVEHTASRGNARTKLSWVKKMLGIFPFWQYPPRERRYEERIKYVSIFRLDLTFDGWRWRWCGGWGADVWGETTHGIGGWY